MNEIDIINKELVESGTHAEACTGCGGKRVFLYIGANGMICHNCKDRETALLNGNKSAKEKIQHQLDNLGIIADYIEDTKIKGYVNDAIERINKLLKEV
jgi:hypothetical protein